MYAIIKTGGKQYKVKEGDIIRIEKLSNKVEEEVKFEEVVMLNKGDDIVTDKEELKKIEVAGKVLKHEKYSKAIIFKYKAKKRYHAKTGHRQPYSSVKITKIA